MCIITRFRDKSQHEIVNELSCYFGYSRTGMKHLKLVKQESGCWPWQNRERERENPIQNTLAVKFFQQPDSYKLYVEHVSALVLPSSAESPRQSINLSAGAKWLFCNCFNTSVFFCFLMIPLETCYTVLETPLHSLLGQQLFFFDIFLVEKE